MQYEQNGVKFEMELKGFIIEVYRKYREEDLEVPEEEDVLHYRRDDKYLSELAGGMIARGKGNLSDYKKRWTDEYDEAMLYATPEEAQAEIDRILTLPTYDTEKIKNVPHLEFQAATDSSTEIGGLWNLDEDYEFRVTPQFEVKIPTVRITLARSRVNFGYDDEDKE